MLHCAHASLSMTGDVIPNAVRNPVWECHGVQQGRDGEPHPLVPLLQKERDVSASPKQGEVNLARECFTALMLAFSMTGDVIPSVARNPVWECHGVQQGRDGKPHPLVPLL